MANDNLRELVAGEEAELMLGADAPLGDRCSRAGCGGSAVARVNWRNPRIHPETRVKVWLACAEHREFLHDYLQSRGFPVVVTGIDEDVSAVPS